MVAARDCVFTWYGPMKPVPPRMRMPSGLAAARLRECACAELERAGEAERAGRQCRGLEEGASRGHGRG